MQQNIELYPALNVKGPDTETEAVSLLSKFTFSGEDADTVHRLFLGNDIKWDRFISIAREYIVIPILYKNLQQVDAAVPERIMREVRDSSSYTLARNVRYFQALGELVKVFENNGVKALLFKGPVLTAGTYKTLGVREFDDIDILVGRDDFLSIDNVLRKAGFDETGEHMGETGYRSQRVFSNPTGLHLDVHSGVVGRALHSKMLGMRFEDLWERRRPVSFEGVEFNTLSVEDELIYYSIHLAMQHSFRGLRWFVDIHEFIGANGDKIDWAQVLELVSRYKVKRPLFHTLLLTKKLYGTDVPDGVMTELGKVRRKLDDSILRRIWSSNNEIDYLSELFMFDSLSETLKFVLKSFIRYPYMLKHFAAISYKTMKGK